MKGQTITVPVEQDAPGIVDRKSVDASQLETGILCD